MVTSRFQKVATETITPTEINFRILARSITKTLVDKCKSFTSNLDEFQPVNVLGNLGGSYGLIPRPPRTRYTLEFKK